MNRTSNPTAKPFVRLAAIAVGMLAFVGMATACEPPACASDCVTSVTTNPGTTSTTIVTTAKTKVNFTIYNESTRTNAVVSKSSNSLKTSHTITNGAITPDRWYWTTVTATDESGKVYKEHGSFRAAKRNLTVKITRIKLTDDSDSTGTGELEFGMKAAGVDFGAVYTNGDMGSGADKTGLSITKSVSNTAPPAFTIMVEGRDDDCEGIGSLCTSGGGFTYDSGSSDDWDWATASTSAITAPSSNGSGSWSATTTGYPVKFEVYGTWSVTYTA